MFLDVFTCIYTISVNLTPPLLIELLFLHIVSFPFPLLIEEGLGVVVDNKYLFEGVLKVSFPTTTPCPSSIRRGDKR